MRRLLLLGCLLSTPALALDVCVPAREDPRTRICDYSPLQRYQITGMVGFPVNLNFSPNEAIKRTEFAYTATDDKGNLISTWRGPQCGDAPDAKCPKDRYINNTPIWSYAPGRSALVVVTSVDGQERPYRFELISRAAATDCKADDALPGCPGDMTTTDAVSFTYSVDQAAAKDRQSQEQKREAQKAWRAKRDQQNEQIALARLKTDVLYGNRNWNYRAFGDKQKYGYLAPSEVSDNGWLTEFQWPGNVQVPAITILNPVTGEEQAVTPDLQGPMHVVNRAAEWFRLRLGKEAVLDIHNLGFKADRADPQTGTPSPDVWRTVQYQDGK